MLSFLLACVCSAPTDLPSSAPRSVWDVHIDGLEDVPDGIPLRLDGPVERRLGYDVLLDVSLVGEGIHRPLPPLVRVDGRFVSADALPPIEQSIEIELGAETSVQVERLVLHPPAGPASWPAAWSLQATVDGVPTELPRDGDVVWWPDAERLVLEGGGALPPPNRYDESTLWVYLPDLFPTRRARRSGLAVLRGSLHIEPGRGQEVEGNEILVAGVRFPHHASRDGVRVLANDEESLGVLDAIVQHGGRRPLWVVPGGRAVFVEGYLALPPEAWGGGAALEAALDVVPESSSRGR